LPAQAGISRLFSGVMPPPNARLREGNEREILMMPARASAGNDVPSSLFETGKLCFPER